MKAKVPSASAVPDVGAHPAEAVEIFAYGLKVSVRVCAVVAGAFLYVTVTEPALAPNASVATGAMYRVENVTVAGVKQSLTRDFVVGDGEAEMPDDSVKVKVHWPVEGGVRGLKSTPVAV